ncbi:MAG: lamin tail domain-containing protein, partial [Verrucomicrobia bacterium]|nr:lamin tail domain-containing protein [Verrucomicrobiota bacterium]
MVINEIHFDPPEKKPLEFIELHNAGDAPAHLLGWQLEKFKFPETTLAPGGFVVVAQDPVAFQKAYGFAPLGPLPGKLKNNGERITLRDAG